MRFPSERRGEERRRYPRARLRRILIFKGRDGEKNQLWGREAEPGEFPLVEVKEDEGSQQGVAVFSCCRKVSRDEEREQPLADAVSLKTTGTTSGEQREGGSEGKNTDM